MPKALELSKNTLNLAATRFKFADILGNIFEKPSDSLALIALISIPVKFRISCLRLVQKLLKNVFTLSNAPLILKSLKKFAIPSLIIVNASSILRLPSAIAWKKSLIVLPTLDIFSHIMPKALELEKNTLNLAATRFILAPILLNSSSILLPSTNQFLKIVKALPIVDKKFKIPPKLIESIIPLTTLNAVFNAPPITLATISTIEKTPLNIP